MYHSNYSPVTLVTLRDLNRNRAMSKILIVDDQPLNAEAVSRVIESEFDEVICAQSEAEYREAMAAHAGEIDVVVMDLMLDPYMAPKGDSGTVNLSGLELIREAVREGIDVGFVVFTQFAHAQVAIECYKAGALGFVPKVSASTQSLVGSIRSATARKVSIVNDEFDAMDINKILAYSDPTLCDLSQDQIDVISFLYSGNSYAETADILDIASEVSLRNKISRMLRKTPYSGMNQILVHAARRGWRQLGN